MTATTVLPAPTLDASRSAVSNDLAGDHERCDAQGEAVPGIPLAPDHCVRDAHISTVGGSPLTPSHRRTASHGTHAGGNNLPPTTDRAKPISLPSAASPSGPDQADRDIHQPTVGAGTLQDALLGLAAETLTDIERVRVATENRLRAMRDDHGVSDTPEYKRAEAILEALAAAEHQATLDLGRQMRQHPLGPWVAATVGIGPKQGARLIAAIGDPYWNTLEDRPRRGPAELWAFCGYKPGQKRQKGVRSNWNPDAKMRAHLCAEAVVKAGIRKMNGCDDGDGYDWARRTALTPQAAVYLKARASWSDRDVSDGHKHNHALRCVAKRILRDLYVAAKTLQENAA